MEMLASSATFVTETLGLRCTWGDNFKDFLIVIAIAMLRNLLKLASMALKAQSIPTLQFRLQARKGMKC